jgi:hypothetical protein
MLSYSESYLLFSGVFSYYSGYPLAMEVTGGPWGLSCMPCWPEGYRSMTMMNTGCVTKSRAMKWYITKWISEKAVMIIRKASIKYH